MDRRSKFVLCLIAGSAGLALTLRSSYVRGQEQTPAAQSRPAANRSVILLDPAHGGTDPGADLGDKIAEKDITLALAAKLRTALAAQGFTVVLTRDSAAADPVPAQQRAEIANHSRAIACISLHATRSDSGVHVYTSALPAQVESTDTLAPIRWETAQESFVAQSLQLANGIKSALATAALPAQTGVATVPPLDSMTCPAVAIEFAPLNTIEAAGRNIDGAAYQDSAVRALTAALAKWRTDTSAPPPTPKTVQ
ncbi:MAG TPA: N-acetylmuramoyl-L-alanine amidase [Acidobacteriaceae bacterium]|nr:N-acetylmuramoyl-L-alanine amidase [Acidobacteriaceae bacterium]